jgi:hypothetical protein
MPKLSDGNFTVAKIILTYRPAAVWKFEVPSLLVSSFRPPYHSQSERDIDECRDRLGTGRRQ